MKFTQQPVIESDKGPEKESLLLSCLPISIDSLIIVIEDQ